MTRTGWRAAFAATLIGILALAATPAAAQMSDDDLAVRIEQLEAQMRRLTGQLEELQYKNQQLENQLKRMGEDNEYRFQEMGKGGGRAAPGGRQGAAAPPSQSAYVPPQPAEPPQQQSYPQSYGSQSYAQQPAAQPGYVAQGGGGRRGDAFDPSQNPSAAGAPRALGTVSGESTPAPGRAAGAPMDIGRMAGAAAADPSLQSGLPAPPTRNPNATGAQMAALPPSGSPKGEFDVAFSHLQQRDYAGAEQAFRDFLRKYPSDRLAGDATYFLGESLFQGRAYKDAAESFLIVTQRFGSSPKAAEAMLRLGQSLAALKQKELACSSFAEVGRKFPRVSPTVKQQVEREQKRVGC